MDTPGFTPCVVGSRNTRKGCQETATYLISQESILVNTGDRWWNVQESGSNGLETTPKSSDVHQRSQRGHSTQGLGKPATRGRATACRGFEAI